MTVRYKITSTSKPGAGKEGEKVYFPRLTGSSPIRLDEIAGILAERSSASRGDVHQVLLDFAQLIPELMAHGKSILIDEFGSFQLHARVSTADSPEKISFRNIEEIRMSFRPDRKIKEKLKRIKFQRDE